MANVAVHVEGTAELVAALTALGAEAPQALGRALYEEGLELAAAADALVPRDTGTLAASKFVLPPTGTPVEVVVGYGGAAGATAEHVGYALAVHENPRSGKTGGLSPQGRKYRHWAEVGQWKYLEIPFKAMTAGFTDRLAGRLKATLLKGG